MATADLRTASGLREGQRLDQPTFHRLYQQASERDPSFRAELVRGKVRLRTMPISNAHGRPHALLTGWLLNYQIATPECQASTTPTLVLGPAGEPEPDLVLRRLPEFGGRCVEDEDHILHGPPELAVEVSRTTVRRDLDGKFRDYEDGGVGEYLVHLVEQREVLWWTRPTSDSGFAPLAADRDGVFHSRLLPGLWLDVPALLRNDAAAVIATLQRGLASRGGEQD